MNIKELFKDKKVYLKIEDSWIKDRILTFFDESIIVPDEKEADICVSDKEIPGYIKVGRVFSIDFLKKLSNIQKLGIYKSIYFYFPEEVFKKEYDSIFFYGFILTAFFLPFIKFPVPPDDLLRHIVIYKYNYDYSNVFINTLMPSWNFYLPFDFIVGKIHLLFSILPWENARIYGPLFSTYYIFLILAVYAVKVNVGSIPRTYFVFFVSLFLYLSLGRVFLERPTVLASILFLISLGYFIKKEEKKALAFSFLIPAFYYLFFIYLIPLIFFSRKVIYILIAGFIYWNLIAYSFGGSYFVDIYTYILSLSKELILAGENSSFFKILGIPLVLFIVLLSILYFKNSQKKYIYPSFWFLLSNQIRYFEVIGPSLLFALRDFIIEFLNKVLKGSYVAIFLLSISLFVYTYTGTYSSKTEVDPKICEMIKGKNVKTLLGPNFFLVYFCEDVKVNPAMEVRWTKDINFEKDLLEGKINCKGNEIYKYDYLYENTLKGFYDCLDLKYRDREYTLWKVKHEK